MWSRNLPGTQILWPTQNEPTVNAYLQVDSMTLWFPRADPEANTCSSESITESTRLSLSPRFRKPSQDEALVLLLLTCWLYVTRGRCRSSCVCSTKKRAHVQLHTTCLTQYKLVLSKLKPRAFRVPEEPDLRNTDFRLKKDTRTRTQENLLYKIGGKQSQIIFSRRKREIKNKMETWTQRKATKGMLVSSASWRGPHYSPTCPSLQQWQGCQ